MRLLHLSDVHIGVENYGRPATEADLEALPSHFAPGMDRAQYLGVSTRSLDFLSTLDYAVSYAVSNDVDAVLFAGDAYKNRDPTQTHQREFARRIARLAGEGVPVFLTVGNHDLPRVANRATALEIFPTLDVANVTVGSTLDTYRITTRAGELQVVSLPWVRLGQIMAQEETRDMSMEQITRVVEDRLTAGIQREAENLDPSLPAVLCAHVTASSAQLSSERSMMLGTDHVLTLSTLANLAFDYVALGHVHRHQVLTQNPITTYSGSLQRIDFSEEKEDKGFCVIDLDTSAARGERMKSFQFVTVAARTFTTVQVTVRADQDPTETTVNAISKKADEVAGAVVRVRIEMPEVVESAFQETPIRQALAAAHHIAGIERQVIRTRRTRLGDESAATLTPLQALRQYAGLRNMTAEREHRLLEQGERLIQEELEGE
jgi:exonuclease SbcD